MSFEDEILEGLVFAGKGNGFLRCGIRGALGLMKVLRIGEGVSNPERIGVAGNEAGGWGNSERRNDSPLLIVLSAIPEAVVSCESAEVCFDAEGARESPRCLGRYITGVRTYQWVRRSNERVGHTGLQASPGSFGSVSAVEPFISKERR